MKMLKKMMALAVMTLTLTVPTFAADFSSLAAKDARFTVTNGNLGVVCETPDNPIKDIVSTFLDSTRNCSGYEFNGDGFFAGNPIGLDQSIAEKVAYRTNWTTDWVNQHAPEIVANGLTKEDAIKTVFEYVCTHYAYSTYLRDSGSLAEAHDAADAYSLIANNDGVCIAFACTFRAIVEAIPFENGVVNWNATQPTYQKVAIVENGPHMWNEIQDEATGRWLIYDTSAGSVFHHSGISCFNAYQLLRGEAYDFGTGKVYHY